MKKETSMLQIQCQTKKNRFNAVFLFGTVLRANWKNIAKILFARSSTYLSLKLSISLFVLVICVSRFDRIAVICFEIVNR